ncbi:MAG: putative lipid II flippase FtsW [Patescibacteria group bacterium]
MKAHLPDYPLIFIVSFLVVFGLVILSSASVVLSHDSFGESYYFLKRQLILGLPLGIACFLICQRIDYHRWQKLAFPLLIFSLILLILVFIPSIGYSHAGARRWINLGIGSLQPFEFVKITLILYLAALLSKKGEKKEVIKKSLMPMAITAGIIMLLVFFQPNMSALGFVVLLVGFLYFLAGLNLSYLIGFGLLALIGLWGLIKVAPYRANRLTVFLHPEIDPQGMGYQINQALLAIGSGGLFGLGLTHSIQKWKYLPEAISDSIFAIIAEELGLIGAGFLVILFVILAWRGLKIAKNAPDKFGFLLAGGITGWIFFQAFINMAAISGMIPLTGMPLPFISYGSSALVSSLIGMGILVNISKYTNP